MKNQWLDLLVSIVALSAFIIPTLKIRRVYWTPPSGLYSLGSKQKH